MSEFSDYLTVSGISVSESTVKGSRFIGIAMPCSCEEDIRSNLKQVQTDFPNATHYCYGAVFGGTNRSERSSDNGEPSGTAAKPILSVIRGNDLTDTMVVVVRYFGGIKLGIPGLIRAYKTSSAEALDNAGVVEKIAGDWFRLGFGYDRLPQVMKLLKDMDLRQRAQDFGNSCTLEAWVRLASEKDFLEKLDKLNVTCQRI